MKTCREATVFLLAGHAVGGVSKGRLFPLSRDDLVECTALLLAVRAGQLDVLHVPVGSLDVLAQQIAAEVACRECDETELYDLIRRAQPFEGLAHEDFMAVVRMLGEGFSTRRGRWQNCGNIARERQDSIPAWRTVGKLSPTLWE